MQKVSAYIIAFNEAKKIRAAIESVRWADEIIVADSWSTDGTAEIAQQLGARVIQIKFEGYGPLRNKVIAECTHDWVFSLDSDERCTSEVAHEIASLVNSASPLNVYFVPRRNFFLGRWIKHSGWFPNYRQPQLFRKDAMQYGLQPVHEGYVLTPEQPIGHLRNAIWQYPFKDMSQVIWKMDRYSTLGVKRLEGKKISMWLAVGHACWSFVKHYFFKPGILDGQAGFVIAFGNFEGTFYRYVKALELQEKSRWAPPQ